MISLQEITENKLHSRKYWHIAKWLLRNRKLQSEDKKKKQFIRC